MKRDFVPDSREFIINEDVGHNLYIFLVFTKGHLSIDLFVYPIHMQLRQKQTKIHLVLKLSEALNSILRFNDLDIEKALLISDIRNIRDVNELNDSLLDI